MRNLRTLKKYSYILLVIINFISSSCSSDDGIDLGDIMISRNLIAHRGSWKKNNLPQNSIDALKEALMLDLYGVELDVCQTGDSILVISHSEYIADIKISQMSYVDLAMRTSGSVPTLDDFFSICQMSNSRMKILLDLKSCSPTAVIELVKLHGLESRVEFLSFSRNYCDRLVKMGYGQQVFYMGGDLAPSVIKQMQYGGISYNEDVLFSTIEWITEAHNLGIKVHVWTVNRFDRINFFIKKGVTLITDVPC